MNQVKDIVAKIEELREQLNGLINEETKFTDSKIVKLSQKLDEALNMYNELIKGLKDSDSNI